MKSTMVICRLITPFINIRRAGLALLTSVGMPIWTAPYFGHFIDLSICQISFNGKPQAAAGP